jgi:hypothetical protein
MARTYQIERHWVYQICLIRAIFNHQGDGVVIPLVEPTVEYV